MRNFPAFYEHNRDRLTTYWRTLRVCAWIKRFTKNARSPKKDRETGPLTTTETETQRRSWLRRVQHRGSEHMHVDRLELNLQLNQDRLLECRGRLQGIFPIYVPDGTIFFFYQIYLLIYFNTEHYNTIYNTYTILLTLLTKGY